MYEIYTKTENTVPEYEYQNYKANKNENEIVDVSDESALLNGNE